MTSERSKLEINRNNSKNTRMDLVSSMAVMDFRKDELMHIGRYFKACQTPKDHVYEWNYTELAGLLLESGFEKVSSRGTSINPSKIPNSVWSKREKQIKAVYEAFGENTAFSCVALAPLFPTKYCKNVIFELKKRKE